MLANILLQKDIFKHCIVQIFNKLSQQLKNSQNIATHKEKSRIVSQ